MGKKKTELRDCEERAIRAEYALKALSDQLESDNYLTAEEFVEKLMPQMRDYLVKTYGSEKCHPHDLATAAASFMDAYWIISDHRGI